MTQATPILTPRTSHDMPCVDSCCELDSTGGRGTKISRWHGIVKEQEDGHIAPMLEAVMARDVLHSCHGFSEW